MFRKQSDIEKATLMNEPHTVTRDARAALFLFTRTGMIREVLSLYPLSYYDQRTISMWELIFAKHPIALKEIELIGVRSQFTLWQEKVLSQRKRRIVADAVATLAIARLERKTESPFHGATLGEIVLAIKESLGHPIFRRAMLDEAERNLKGWIKTDRSFGPQSFCRDFVKNAQVVNIVVQKLFGPSEPE